MGIGWRCVVWGVVLGEGNGWIVDWWGCDYVLCSVEWSGWLGNGCWGVDICLIWEVCVLGI